MRKWHYTTLLSRCMMCRTELLRLERLIAISCTKTVNKIKIIFFIQYHKNTKFYFSVVNSEVFLKTSKLWQHIWFFSNGWRVTFRDQMDLCQYDFIHLLALLSLSWPDLCVTRDKVQLILFDLFLYIYILRYRWYLICASY